MERLTRRFPPFSALQLSFVPRRACVRYQRPSWPCSAATRQLQQQRSYKSSHNHSPPPQYATAAAVATACVVALLSNAFQDAHAEAQPKQRQIRLAEVHKHGHESSNPWVIKGTRVYDITDWIPSHPGGDVILRAAGGNIDQYWQIFSIHQSQYVYDILEQYYIGDVDPRDLVDGKMPQADIADPFDTDPVRDPRLKILSKRPCNAETQNESLDPYLTPNDVFYVRNHLWVPTIKDSTQHTLTVEREDGEEVVYTFEDLKKKFKEHTVTAVLQCSGNRRSHMSNASRPAQGLQWGIGGIGNAEWTGFLLRDILKDAGFNINDIPEDVKHAQFKGDEAYGASIPIEKAVDKLGDVLIAHKMNGKPLPPDHGFPLRIIVPGHVAARSVKWVKRIILSDEESTSQWQRRDYKCFGPNETSKTVDWDEAQAIQETPVQSAITKMISVTEHDRSALEAYGLEEDSVAVEGYAFAGGGRRIIRVDISANNGHTWDQAELVEPPEDNPAKGHKAWAWQRWKYTLPRDQVGRWFLVKAVDESYNTQPADHDSTWNFRGNLTTAWHKVKYERAE